MEHRLNEPESSAAPLPGVATEETPPASLLDRVLATGQGPSSSLEQFLAEPEPWKALALWLGRAGHGGRVPTRREVVRTLVRDLARLDTLLTRQINAILGHPRFQQLEASWRGLRYLIGCVEEGENVKIRLLNVSWKELCRDMDRALEFDQSQLFRKVYSEEFGTPGGEPFGVLLGDYQVRHRPGPDHPTDDVSALRALSQVAAAAFAPFIAGVDPALLGLERFTELERLRNLTQTFDQPEYLKWRAFRDTEDARFVGLTLPRVLMRLPHADDGSRADGFRFHEETDGPDRSLWGNAVYPFGAVLIRAFIESGWFGAIRGAERGEETGGLVEGMPLPWHGTERRGVALKGVSDAFITDALEKDLGELGLIPLCHCPHTGRVAFPGNSSVQKSRTYDEAVATANARLSAMLQHVLCVSRFAHYLKVIGRDKVGSFESSKDCESFLHNWLLRYVSSRPETSLTTQARFPLREAQVQVRELSGRPGSYSCVFHLCPHFQLEHMSVAVRLVTELAPPGRVPGVSS
jgi:type VI secretion system protein ImpD